MIADPKPLSSPKTSGTSENAAAEAALEHILEWKHGPVGRRGWGPSLRRRFGYATPDDIYETTVFGHVSADTTWLDVGCGRDIFPSNRATARYLAGLCKLLVGLDPDDNIDENEFVHRREKTFLENYRSDTRYDLITLRMVAEHVADPGHLVAALRRLTAPGGSVIVYTVSKWSPISVLARLTPTFLHRSVKRFLWQAEDRDTFPVVYRMNTRGALTKLFEGGGFSTASFRYLDDCRTLQRWKTSNYCELALRRLLRSAGMPYPESCILAVYRRR